MIWQGGSNICGATIGVLCLESYFPKPPGHIKNPSGLSFPVLYQTVPGATVAKMVNAPSPDFVAPFLDAARALESEGVGAITGSCGFMALFQKELAGAVSIPVFASSLIQLPMVHAMLGDERTVAVLTASAANLTPDHFAAVGAGEIPVVVAGMEQGAEFREVILEGKRNDLDAQKIEAEIMGVVEKLAADNPRLGAVVLECTDLTWFAPAIQRRLGLPVFDLTSLAGMVHQAVYRQPYAGVMPPKVTRRTEQ